MDLLRFRLEIGLQFRLHFQALARVRLRAVVHVMQQRRQVRQHKRLRILRADVISSLLRQVRLMALFIHREQQFLLLTVEIHFLLVLVELQLRAVHQGRILRVFQQFHQRL